MPSIPINDLLKDTNGQAVSEWGSQGEVLPHVLTHLSIWNTMSKVYSFRWDEALRNSRTNALAMRRDCYLDALLQERAYPTVNRKWQICCEDEKDKSQKKAAQDMQAIIKKTKEFKRLLKYLAMETSWYGRYGSQIVWRDAEVNGKTRQVVAHHSPIHGDKIQTHWDGTKGIYINGQARHLFPAELIVGTDLNPVLLLRKEEWRRQFIFHKFDVVDADFFEGEMAGRVDGRGLRDCVYWAWFMRDEMLSWAVDFMKKVGTMGLLIFPFLAGNTVDQARAENTAQQARTNTAITMPIVQSGTMNDHSLEPIHIHSNTQGIDSLQNMIANYWERHIERLIVGQSMSSGGGAKGGLEGDGRAEFAVDTKHQLCHYDADNLAETLTSDLVAPAQRLNFPETVSQFSLRFEFVVEDPQKKEKIEGAKTIVSMGGELVKAEVYELIGLSIPEEGEETIGGQQAEAALGADGKPIPGGGKPSPGAKPPGQSGLGGNWKLTKSQAGLVEKDTKRWKPNPALTPKAKPAEANRNSRHPELFGQATGAWGAKYDEELHPRDEEGRWVSKGHIVAAANSPEQYKQISANLTPENKAKLDAEIERHNADPDTYRHADAAALAADSRLDPKDYATRAKVKFGELSEKRTDPYTLQSAHSEVHTEMNDERRTANEPEYADWLDRFKEREERTSIIDTLAESFDLGFDTPEDIAKTLAETKAGFGQHGADEKQLKAIDKANEKGKLGYDKAKASVAAERSEFADAKLAAQAKLDALGEEPEEPEAYDAEEPEQDESAIPPEPEEDDYEDEADYKTDLADWSEKLVKIEREYQTELAAHNAEVARSDAEHDKWETDHAAWSEQTDELESELKEIADQDTGASQETLDDALAKWTDGLSRVAAKISEKLNANIEAESEADPEPEEP